MDEKIRIDKREYIKTLTSLNDIPKTETGDLLLMALSIITVDARPTKSPDEVLEELQQLRFNTMYTNGG